MQKRADSLNGMGRTMIATDIPTRAKLKAAAAAAGMPLSTYLRVLADDTLKGKQLLIPGQTAPTVTGQKQLGVLMKAILLLLGIESHRDKAHRYDSLIEDVITESESLGIMPPWDEIVEMRREIEGKKLPGFEPVKVEEAA